MQPIVMQYQWQSAVAFLVLVVVCLAIRGILHRRDEAFWFENVGIVPNRFQKEEHRPVVAHNLAERDRAIASLREEVRQLEIQLAEKRFEAATAQRLRRLVFRKACRRGIAPS